MKRRLKKIKNQGFTLVELIVVIGVLGILLAGTLAVINPFDKISQGNDTRRKSDLETIQKALELYYNDNNQYPSAATSCPQINGSGYSSGIHDTAQNKDICPGDPWTPYIAKLPAEPSNPSKWYLYVPDPSGQAYRLYTSLERGKKDTQICHSDDTKCDGVPTGVFCGTNSSTCDYGVSSPNVSP
jgi:prepilin-type N-terminal cleavage/methylation domain-containing protein